MASLQKYQGKGRDNGKTFYRIQPVLPNGRRPTIRLGTGSKKAESARRAIEDLIDSQHAGDEIEPSAMTRAWLAETAEQSLCQTLVEYGLIEQLPIRFSESNGTTTISRLADSYIKTRGAGQSVGTFEVYQKAKRNLIACFGDVDVTTIQPKHAREFWRWLIEEGNTKVKKGEKLGLGSNTAKQRLRYARGFFEQAVEDGLLPKNPFKIKGLKTTQTAAEKEYVPVEAIAKVIEYCPTLEWKLLFAMVRCIPTRMPSEIKELTWDDVDWEASKMLIHSPKTRTIGKSARWVPIFPSLRPWLELAFNEARKLSDDGHIRGLSIFSTLGQNTNPATTAKKIVKRAKLEQWPDSTWSNFFNSLRASTETDLMDQYGLRRACQWSGNSATTAMKNYALVRKSDFDDFGALGKSDAKSDARNVIDAKSDAELASIEKHGPKENQQKKHCRELESSDSAFQWALRDLNPRPPRCKRGALAN